LICGFVDQMRSRGFAVESVCRVLREQGLKIAARTYRAWRRGRPLSARARSDAALTVFLRGLEGLPASLYGRRKMTRHLRRNGFPKVAFCTVDRLMRQLGMRGASRLKKVRTTIPGKDGPRACDLVNRDFTAQAPNRRWVADFTYVRTWSGFAYVAFVVDCCAQRIVGWHAQMTKHANLVLTPVKMAIWERARQGHPTGAGLVHHSDAGSQYTSIKFTEHLALEQVKPSIGTVGDAYDNALMESVIGLYKAEAIRTAIFGPRQLKTLTDVEATTGNWVHWWNTERLHSSFGYRPPDEVEAAYYNQHNPSGETNNDTAPKP
jgi:transposase InsO family protein